MRLNLTAECFDVCVFDMFHTTLEWLKEHAVRVEISYPTLFGIEYTLVLCRYGLETVTQLFADGCLGYRVNVFHTVLTKFMGRMIHSSNHLHAQTLCV